MKIDLNISKKLGLRLAKEVEERSAAYLLRYGSWPMKIGSALFDRRRRLRWAGPCGCQQLNALGVALHT